MFSGRHLSRIMSLRSRVVLVASKIWGRRLLFYLVYLIYLIHLIYLVYLIHLIYLIYLIYPIIVYGSRYTIYHNYRVDHHTLYILTKNRLQLFLQLIVLVMFRVRNITLSLFNIYPISIIMIFLISN